MTRNGTPRYRTAACGTFGPRGAARRAARAAAQRAGRLGSAAAYRCAVRFGSVARGDGDADSDVDLLLIRQRRTDADDEAWQAQVSRLREDVTAWTGNTYQVYDIGSDDLERHIAAHDPLVTAWRTDAITVCGTDLRGLLRDLGHRVTA